MLEYVRSLEFDATPDYKHLHGLIGKMMEKNNLTNDNGFDWLTKASIDKFYKELAVPEQTNEPRSNPMSVNMVDEKAESSDKDVLSIDEKDEEKRYYRLLL
eukprot:TRINITY_DN3062_c0_g5_i1.p4 TRINITY_DN3062_c0_g5~~TRINITY_DN3062_c0_g5_i1.p4  ORF type:complete len:101 (+),score=26.20 TRINITY_DN3062_c0_g5_i1:950-1252(+)